MSMDWGEASGIFDEIKEFVGDRDLTTGNEAQTRFDVIDRLIREVLVWKHGQVTVEERADSGYIDYVLRSGDYTIVVEAKRAGSAFPSPTKKTHLKLSGSVLGVGEIASAILQAKTYGEEKGADVIVVTNGFCWCFFSLKDTDVDGYAHLLFPFNTHAHPEKLFNLFCASQVEKGSLDTITNRSPISENRLIATIRVLDSRVDRNQIADYITPAIDRALHSDALLSDKESLEKCFVATDNRTRYDSQLGMYLAESKPQNVYPAKRIRKDKKLGYLEEIVQVSDPSFTPPVTLIIGPVGVGKSTYLTHFELVTGRQILDEKKHIGSISILRKWAEKLILERSYIAYFETTLMMPFQDIPITPLIGKRRSNRHTTTNSKPLQRVPLH